MAENEAHVFVPSTPVVGFEYDAWEIKDRLIGSSERRLDVIFIVGRGGIGKTTLALKVFNEPIIAYHFDIRAWITVSQVYQKRDLLLGILSSPDIVPSGDIHRMSNGTLGEVLYKSLSLYRYLIVMDDIWDTQAWDDLKRCFPNNNSGSRILLTSRIREVALHAKPDRTPYDMRFRSNEESWDLLQEKIFHTKICPPELIEVGKEIAEKCWGLPLAIVVIGGLLSKTEKNEYSSWKQIAESMNSYDPYESLVAVLEVTYNYLPNHLKPCFLYFGAFPEGYDIPVFKLIWLWTAEGFVKTNGDKSLEETAMDYLVDLIERSLILTSSERSSNGEVKSCGIHDVLRDLCLRKAEEENFMQIIDENHHQLAGLPNLEVLKLLDNAFDGDWLDSDLLPFPKLKFLKLESLNISRWEALRHHFPSLQRLVLIRCINLDEIPSDIGHIPTLETIELTRSSAADSAKKILDEQYEIGNDRLKILIVQERKWRSNDGNMLIRVRRGINLAVRGTIRIDPFIGITMGKQKLKTLVVVNNCNPEWNDELTFYVANPNIPIRLTVYDNLILNFKMGEAEIDIKPYLECLKMGLHNHPTGTKVYRVQPNRTNCLAEESCIVWNNGKMTQDMILRLRNVECRKVEVQIEWIELLGSKVLKG